MRKHKQISYQQNRFFDKYLFRPQDHVRIILKRLLSVLGWRDKQSCKYCGRDQKIVWSVKNEMWDKLPEKYKNKALCIECFVELHPNMLANGDFTFISFVDPFRDEYTVFRKTKKKNEIESLRELIDNEPPNLENGTKYYCIKEKATFVLDDGEWVNEKHLNDTSTDDYLG